MAKDKKNSTEEVVELKERIEALEVTNRDLQKRNLFLFDQMNVYKGRYNRLRLAIKR